MANIQFNPALTTSPASTFVQTTQGYIQGDFVDDPSVRMQLCAGVISTAVTQPMWGGMLIEETVPTVGESPLGSTIQIAAGDSTGTGFSVFTQAYNMTLVPGNSVPVAVASQTINFFRLGSNARIKVQCSAGLVSSVEGGAINQQVSWDFVNQQLIPYNATPGALPVRILSVSANSQVVSFNSGTGAVSWASGNCAVILI